MDISPLQFSAPPEFYIDNAGVAYGPFGFAFNFGLVVPLTNEAKAQAIVRMSPQHTYIFYQLLKKYLREFESKNGKINVYEDLFTELGIEKEI